MNGWAAAAGLVGIATAFTMSATGADAQMQHSVLVTSDWLAGHLDDGNVVAQQIDDALESVGVRDGLHHVVVYATNPLFASKALMTMEVMGLRGMVHLLDGGWGGWVEEGRPVFLESPNVTRGVLTLRPVDDILVSADWIHERLGDESVALVDARPDAEYTGADGGMGGMANPDHIPGARQMYREELIESRELPRLHDRDALEALFDGASAGDGDTVAAYCMVGWRWTMRLNGPSAPERCCCP